MFWELHRRVRTRIRFPILSAVGLRAEPATHLVKNKITNTEINLGTKKYADGELWAQRVFGNPVAFRGGEGDKRCEVLKR